MGTSEAVSAVHVSFLACVHFSSTDEILLGREKTTTVIDGSGVLHDPTGLDHTELIRLAKARKMVANFDKSKLGKDGYLVLCEDQDVKLPCTYIVCTHLASA